MKLQLLSFLLFGSLYCQSQNMPPYTFEEKQADSISYTLDSILIVGMGSAATRVFLDDVTDYVIEELEKTNIIAHYHFLGKSPKEARSVLDTLNKEGYKAILLFIPRGSSYEIQASMSRTSSNTSLGSFTTTMARSKILYEEHFNIDLCEPGKELNIVWSASVNVACDPGKPKTAKKIAEKIIDRFKGNNYLK